jgi:type I restriction enzyme, R subunit
MVKPEDAAHQGIDDAVALAGSTVQNAKSVNLHAARGVAIREFLLKTGHGSADYLLYVDGNAVGVHSADRDHIPTAAPDVQSWPALARGVLQMCARVLEIEMLA